MDDYGCQINDEVGHGAQPSRDIRADAIKLRIEI